MDYLIDGVLGLSGPLHITSPGGARYNPSLKRITSAKKDSFPLTRTRTQTFFVSAEAAEGEERAPVVDVPVIPANTLRGRLRRLASDLVLARTGAVSWQVYNLLRIGAVTAKPNANPAATETIQRQREDVLMGLFGGGPNLLAGRLAVSPGLPPVDVLMRAGIIREEAFAGEVLRVAAVRDLLAYEPIIRKDDLADGQEAIAATQVRDFASARLEVLEKIAASNTNKQLAAKIEKAKKEGDAEALADLEAQADEDLGKTTLRSVSYIEQVVANTPFYVRFALRDVSEAQAGLFVESLAAFAREGIIGGKASVGYGTFAPRNITISDGESSEPVFGTSGISDRAPVAGGPIVTRLVRAFAEAALDGKAYEAML